MPRVGKGAGETAACMVEGLPGPEDPALEGLASPEEASRWWGPMHT